MPPKRNNKPKTIPVVPKSEPEYDVVHSMQRVRQYKPKKGASHFYQHTDANADKKINDRELSNKNENRYYSTSEPTRDFYFRLEDKISDFSSKNESAHSDLRKEFENKLGNVANDVEKCKDQLHSKIDYSLLIKVIIGFLTGMSAIIGAWYALSYSPLISNNDKHSEYIHSLDKRLHHIENSAVGSDTISLRKL